MQCGLNLGNNNGSMGIYGDVTLDSIDQINLLESRLSIYLVDLLCQLSDKCTSEDLIT